MNRQRSNNSINTISIFVVLILLYVVSISIEGILGIETTLIQADAETHIEILLVSLLVTLAFVFGYRFTWLRKMEVSFSDPSAFVSYKKSKYNQFLAGIWLMVLLLGVAFFLSDFSQSFSSYFGNVTTTYQNSVFSFYKTTLYSLTAILGALLIYTRNYLAGGALCLFLFLLGLLSYDKDPMVLCVLALASSSAIYTKRYRVLTFIAIIPGILCLAFLSRVYSFYRGSGLLVESTVTAFEGFSFMKLDGAGPYSSIVFALENTHEFRYGATYLEELIVLVPKLLYSNRPPDIAEQFAQLMIFDYFPGAGLGFSPLAEAYLNFHYFGFIIQFFFVIMIFSLMWRLLTKLLTQLTPLTLNEMKVVYRVIGFYLLLLLFRSPALFFVKGLIYMFVPMIFGAFFWFMMRRVK